MTGAVIKSSSNFTYSSPTSLTSSSNNEYLAYLTSRISSTASTQASLLNIYDNQSSIGKHLLLTPATYTVNTDVGDSITIIKAASPLNLKVLYSSYQPGGAAVLDPNTSWLIQSISPYAERALFSYTTAGTYPLGSTIVPDKVSITFNNKLVVNDVTGEITLPPYHSFVIFATVRGRDNFSDVSVNCVDTSTSLPILPSINGNTNTSGNATSNRSIGGNDLVLCYPNGDTERTIGIQITSPNTYQLLKCEVDVHEVQSAITANLSTPQNGTSFTFNNILSAIGKCITLNESTGEFSLHPGMYVIHCVFVGSSTIGEKQEIIIRNETTSTDLYISPITVCNDTHTVGEGGYGSVHAYFETYDPAKISVTSPTGTSTWTWSTSTHITIEQIDFV